MPNDAQPADSSPAPVSDLGALSASDLQTWRMTGSVPDAPADDSPESLPDSTPAPPVDQAASTDATSPPASEPGTPTTPTPKKKNADSRIQELLAERHATNERIAALERQLASRAPQEETPPAAPSPAPVLSEFPAFDAWAVDHPEGSWEQYITASVAHTARETLKAERQAEKQAQEQDARTQSVQARATTFAQRRDAAMAADPTYRERLSPEVLRLVPVDLLAPNTPVGPGNVIAQEIIESEHSDALLLHLSEHPDEFAALQSLPSATAIARAVAKLEARLDGPSSAAVSTPKTVSTAPAPPVTLGSRPAHASGDEIQAAIRDKDTGRYMKLMNARELAAR